MFEAPRVRAGLACQIHGSHVMLSELFCFVVSLAAEPLEPLSGGLVLLGAVGAADL